MDFTNFLSALSVPVIVAAILAISIVKFLPVFTRWANGQVLTVVGDGDKPSGWSTYTLKTGEKVVVNRHARWVPEGTPSRDSQDDWDEAHSMNRPRR